MNWYWVISGIFMIIGGVLHTVVGEKNVISHLATKMPETGFSRDHAFNLIRWFWYLGSFISFWVGAVALIIGATELLPSENVIGYLLATLMFGFSVLTFVAVAILNPKELGKLNQVGLLVLVTILLWVGSIG